MLTTQFWLRIMIFLFSFLAFFTKNHPKNKLFDLTYKNFRFISSSSHSSLPGAWSCGLVQLRLAPRVSVCCWTQFWPNTGLMVGYLLLLSSSGSWSRWWAVGIRSKTYSSANYYNHQVWIVSYLASWPVQTASTLCSRRFEGWKWATVGWFSSGSFASSFQICRQWPSGCASERSCSFPEWPSFALIWTGWHGSLLC